MSIFFLMSSFEMASSYIFPTYQTVQYKWVFLLFRFSSEKKIFITQFPILFLLIFTMINHCKLWFLEQFWKMKPKMNFRSVRMTLRSDGNCCWLLYKRYNINISNFPVIKWNLLLFRFEFKGKSANVSRGTNEEMEFFPKSLKIVEF